MAYRAMISAVRQAKTAGIELAGRQVPRFPDWMQPLVSANLDAADFSADILVALLLAIVGLAVGFVEGIVSLVTGLIKIVYWLLKLVADMIVAMLGRPGAYRADIAALIVAVQGIPFGLKQLVNAWLERYKRATLEEQVLMGGEMVGQIEAFIATFALAGTKAGQVGGVAETGAAAARITSGGALALECAPSLANTAVVAKTTAEGAVVSSQLMMSGQGSGGMPPSSPSSGGGPSRRVAVARASEQVENDLASERSSIAQRQRGHEPVGVGQGPGRLDQRLYNLLERKAVLQRMKTFPERTYLEQSEVTGVEQDGVVTPTGKISSTGKGRIADILEVDGPRATLEDLRSPSTQVKSVKGGMSSPDVEVEFRSTSEIGKQHEVEEQVIAGPSRPAAG